MNGLYRKLHLLKRGDVKTMNTAYKNLIKKLEGIKADQGVFRGSEEDVKELLGIDDIGMKFLTSRHFLTQWAKRDADGVVSREWYLQDLLDKLSDYKSLYEKEEKRFDLKFKLYKIFGRQNFEEALDWVFSSDISEWEHKMSCIKYNCGVFGTELTCGNTLEEAKRLYDFLND